MLISFPAHTSRHSQGFLHPQTIHNKVIPPKATVSKRTKHRGLGTRILNHRTTTSGQNQVIHRVQATRKPQVIYLPNLTQLPKIAIRATRRSLLLLMQAIHPIAKMVRGYRNITHLMDSHTPKPYWTLRQHPLQRLPTSTRLNLHSIPSIPTVLQATGV